MGLQPLILFSDHLFSFFAHLPVEPKFFLLATSPIILEHQWDPPFCRLSHSAISKTTEFVHPLKCVGTYLFKDPKSRTDRNKKLVRDLDAKLATVGDRT